MEDLSRFRSFLNGESFDDQLLVDIGGPFAECSRWDAVKELVEGKRVVHVGCLDHLPLIEERIRNREWMHGLITEAAEKCLGVDIDKAGVDFVRDELGQKNVIYADLTQEPVPEIVNEAWDYVVLGEVVEHLDNPGHFLSSIQSKYADSIAGMIITVPHAFSLTNFERAKQNREVVNSDHRYWFTPYTIAKLMVMAGIEPVSIRFVNCSPLPLRERVRYRANRLLGRPNRFPFYYFQGLVVEGRLTP